MKKVVRGHSKRYEEMIANDKKKRHYSRSWGLLALWRQSSANFVLTLHDVYDFFV
jgi:hypothetical protein